MDSAVCRRASGKNSCPNNSSIRSGRERGSSASTALLTKKKASCPFPNNSPPLFSRQLGEPPHFSATSHVSAVSRSEPGSTTGPGFPYPVLCFHGLRFGAGFAVAIAPEAPAFQPAGTRINRGSRLARPRFASIEEAAPFQRSSFWLARFQQRLRGEELGASLSPPVALRFVSLGCRFSRLRPNSGHPPSFSGFGISPYTCFDGTSRARVATFFPRITLSRLVSSSRAP